MNRRRFACLTLSITAVSSLLLFMRSARGQQMDPNMRTYMEMFRRHRQIHRTVEQLPNGVRTVTESDDPRLAAMLQEHVAHMYGHLAAGMEVQCMSDSLPTMFRNASKYKRTMTLIPKGVSITETSDDPVVLDAIRRHAAEVSGFVKEGMPAMMRRMMQMNR